MDSLSGASFPLSTRFFRFNPHPTATHHSLEEVTSGWYVAWDRESVGTFAMCDARFCAANNADTGVNGSHSAVSSTGTAGTDPGADVRVLDVGDGRRSEQRHSHGHLTLEDRHAGLLTLLGTLDQLAGHGAVVVHIELEELDLPRTRATLQRRYTLIHADSRNGSEGAGRRRDKEQTQTERLERTWPGPLL